MNEMFIPSSPSFIPHDTYADFFQFKIVYLIFLQLIDIMDSSWVNLNQFYYCLLN